jgi:hypothetical protein
LFTLEDKSKEPSDNDDVGPIRGDGNAQDPDGDNVDPDAEAEANKQIKKQQSKSDTDDFKDAAADKDKTGLCCFSLVFLL